MTPLTRVHASTILRASMLSFHERSFALAGLALGSMLSLTGCPTDTGATDAALPDAAFPDAMIYAASEMYGPCVIDEQCPGEGAICRSPLRGYPGGYCTVPCDDRTPCEGLGTQNNHCVQLNGEDRSYCEVNCVNGRDCRNAGDGYSCLAEQLPTGGLCIPVCNTDAQCGAGAACDTHTGRCVAAGEQRAGALTGEPCASNDACASGACVPPANGFTGGYCVANCALPMGFNTNSFFDGTVLPSGGCPEDALCMPFNGSFAARDLGVCLDGCATDGECRDGYFCRKDYQLQMGGPTFSFENGVCWPNG